MIAEIIGVLLGAMLLSGCGVSRRHVARASSSHNIAGGATGLPNVSADRGGPRACSATWTGLGSNDSWGNARNWSADRVPGAQDAACASAGSTIEISHGSYTVELLSSMGRLVLSGGSLTLLGGSSVGRYLTLRAGRLVVDGTLLIYNSLAWRGGKLAGTGVVRLEDGSVDSIDPAAGHPVELELRTLENRGTLKWESGGILGGQNTLLRNAGVVVANSPSSVGIRRISAQARFTVENLGTIQHDASRSTTVIDVPFDNSHMVRVHLGRLVFSDGSIRGRFSTGDFCAGQHARGIVFDGGDFHWGQDIQMSGEIYMRRPARIWAGDIQAAPGVNPACVGS